MSVQPDDLLKWLPLLGALVAAGTFLFAIIQWAAARRLEASKPFLEKQLQLYGEAVRTTVAIATAPDGDAKDAASRRFEELFWGELALVEDKDVESAMLAFRDELEGAKSADTLKLLSLALAHACRQSLSRSWKTPEWESHYQQKPTNPEQPAADP